MQEKDLTKLFCTTDELQKPEESHIQGSIPAWLRGTFLRVGPGKFDFKDFTLNHWLDGYSVLSKFDIQGSSVKFSKRFLQSDSYTRALRAERPVVTEFGTKAYPEKGKGFLARFVSAIMPEMTDNNIGNIFQLGNDFFVTNDSCFFRGIEPSTLETGDKFDANKLFGLNGLTAHPLTDSKGYTYNIGLSVFITGLKFSLIRIPPKGKFQSVKEMFKNAEVVCTIPSSCDGGISYVHSFGMTDRFIIFVEQPYVASVTAITTGLIKGYSVKEYFEWRPNMRNRFHIIEKATGQIIKTEYLSNEAFFFLHFVNCFYCEDLNQIVVDILAFDNPDILDGMYLCKLRNNVIENVPQPSCRRYIIPLTIPKDLPDGENGLKTFNGQSKAVRKSGNKVILTPEYLTESGCEMPVINKNYAGKNYSYFYVSGTIAKNNFSNAICKIDIKNSKVIEWKESEFYYPGESLYVPNPCSEEEDSGVIIASVSDVEKGHDDFLVFIQAKDMKEIGRVFFKEHIPGALHGIFIEST